MLCSKPTGHNKTSVCLNSHAWKTDKNANSLNQIERRLHWFDAFLVKFFCCLKWGDNVLRKGLFFYVKTIFLARTMNTGLMKKPFLNCPKFFSREHFLVWNIIFEHLCQVVSLKIFWMDTYFKITDFFHNSTNPTSKPNFIFRALLTHRINCCNCTLHTGLFVLSAGDLYSHEMASLSAHRMQHNCRPTHRQTCATSSHQILRILHALCLLQCHWLFADHLVLITSSMRRWGLRPLTFKLFKLWLGFWSARAPKIQCHKQWVIGFKMMRHR